MQQAGPIIAESVDHVRKEPYRLPEGLKLTYLNYSNFDEIRNLMTCTTAKGAIIEFCGQFLILNLRVNSFFGIREC